MSAYGTKKRGGDFATQLTFPAVFSEVYSLEQRPLAYTTTYTGPLVSPMAGDDFQSHWHSQKKRDADYMATAKVIATRNARNRYVSSPNGYFGMPTPQLGQRVYANPSTGAAIISSSRRDGSSAPFQTIEAGVLEGGVLRTAEGQAYGKARLEARIGQLNAISSAKDQFVSGISQPPQPYQRPTAMGTEQPAETIQIELNLLLQSIIDSLMGSAKGAPETEGQSVGEFLSRFTFADAIRAISIILRVVPRYGREDIDALEDTMGKIDIIHNLLNGLMDPDMDAGEEQDALSRERLITTYELFKRLREYMVAMIDKVDLSPKERLDLSKTLVKSLGFSKFLRDMSQAKEESRELFRDVASTNLYDDRGRQDFDDYDDDDYDDDEDFDAPATPREDAEHDDQPPEQFDEDERQVFGYESGQFYDAPRQNGRAAPSFFGDDGAEDGEERDYSAYTDTASRLQSDTTKRSKRSVGLISSDIRGVYDPVIGTRTVEVFKPARSEQRSYASAKSATSKPKKMAVVQLLPTGEARIVRRKVKKGTETVPPRGRSVSSVFTSEKGMRSIPEGTTLSETTASVPSDAEQQYKSREQLAEMDRDELVDYADYLNKYYDGIGGKKIRINKGSTVENIRRNFYRRLGYEGRK